jgi:hypothetical protein
MNERQLFKFSKKAAVSDRRTMVWISSYNGLESGRVNKIFVNPAVFSVILIVRLILAWFSCFIFYLD